MSNFPKDFTGTEHYRCRAEEVHGLTFGEALALCDHIEEQDKEIERLREVLEFANNWFKRTRANTDSMPLGAYRTHEVIHDALLLGKPSAASPERSHSASLRTESSEE